MRVSAWPLEHEVTVKVDASAERVWGVLADVERWPEWTESITQVSPQDSGEFGLGSRARVKQPGFPASMWTVTSWRPGAGFTWSSNNGGVTTVADHELSADPDGTTRVTLRLRQTGALAGIIGALFGRRTRRFIQMEAAGLKHHSET